MDAHCNQLRRVTALAILLLLLALRRSAECVARLAKQLETMHKPLPANDGSSRRRRVALSLVTINLSGCATQVSDLEIVGSCPPVVNYSSELYARAVEEMALLSDRSAKVEMLARYCSPAEEGFVSA